MYFQICTVFWSSKCCLGDHKRRLLETLQTLLNSSVYHQISLLSVMCVQIVKVPWAEPDWTASLHWGTCHGFLGLSAGCPDPHTPQLHTCSRRQYFKFYIWSRWNWQIVVSHARTELQNTLLHYLPVQIVCQCGVFAGTWYEEGAQILLWNTGNAHRYIISTSTLSKINWGFFTLTSRFSPSVPSLPFCPLGITVMVDAIWELEKNKSVSGFVVFNVQLFRNLTTHIKYLWKLYI